MTEFIILFQGQSFLPNGGLNGQKKYYVNFTVNPGEGGEGMPVQNFEVEEKNF